MEPIEDGTVVRYHGSITDYHGEYEITSSMNVREWRPDIVRRTNEAYMNENYPDGVCYFLWPVGVDKKFGNQYRSLNSVRRGSITVIPSEDGPGVASTEG